jgi:hypothetical protein
VLPEPACSAKLSIETGRLFFAHPPPPYAVTSSEGPDHSALSGLQSKVSDGVFRQWADKCWHTPGDCFAGDGEGFVGITDRRRNDTPTQVLADFRIGPGNEDHPTFHWFFPFCRLS